MRVAADILKAHNKLPGDQQKKVNAIVRRHIAACFRHGFYPDAIERVWIEAIELVKAGKDDLDETGPKADPVWSYGQYVSPKSEAA